MVPPRERQLTPRAGGHPASSPNISDASSATDRDAAAREDPAAEPLGAQDDLDIALLQLHRLALAATVRAGNASVPRLTPTQIRVLTLLAASAVPLPLSAVADAMYVSPPSASRLCQRLVRDGLITRSAGPGHYILMSLSADGGRVLAAVNYVRVAPFRKLIESLPARRRESAVALLTELGRRGHEQDDAW